MFVFFPLEFAPNGSVHDYIHVKGHKPEIEQSILWAKQTAEGVVVMIKKIDDN